MTIESEDKGQRTVYPLDNIQLEVIAYSAVRFAATSYSDWMIKLQKYNLTKQNMPERKAYHLKNTLQARNSNLTFIHIVHNLGASGEKGNWIYISIKKACCLERRVQSSQVEVWRQSCGKRDK